ncbi:MAG: rhodanese-like domain-containing protein [Devosiaceae bacterium]|nr:rhodanese-like domain-containing protein [Devosiaceae bacterium]
MNFVSRAGYKLNIAMFLPVLVMAALLVAAFAMTTPVRAQNFSAANDITAQDAFAGMQNQTLVMIDVRTEGEWTQSGVATGAIPISMLDPQFLDKLAEVQAQNPGKTIAFICASGRRSTIVQTRLSDMGFSDIFSVYGGTTGSSSSPGWIGEGLPVTPWP